MGERDKPKDAYDIDFVLRHAGVDEIAAATARRSEGTQGCRLDEPAAAANGESTSIQPDAGLRGGTIPPWSDEGTAR